MRFCSLISADGRMVASYFDGGAWALEPGVHALQEVIDSVLDGHQPAVAGAPETDPVFGPPLIPGKIVAVGLNYPMHAEESSEAAPQQPLLFAKFPSAVIGPGDAIVIDDDLMERVDWEVELGVIVGRRMRDVAADDALDYVFGYTVANDVSARDVQFGDGQWTRGKSFDTFCPIGPVVVTPDELGRPDDLRLTTKVNGELMQDDSTRSMIFGVPEILAFSSRCFTLEPGDLVLTGTPSGCGEFMDPPRWLSPGDVVEVAVEGIGALESPVVAAGAEGMRDEG